jgi:hypothetical protein
MHESAHVATGATLCTCESAKAGEMLHCDRKSIVEISMIERVTGNCVGAVTRLSIVNKLDT